MFVRISRCELVLRCSLRVRGLVLTRICDESITACSSWSRFGFGHAPRLDPSLCMLQACVSRLPRVRDMRSLVSVTIQLLRAWICDPVAIGTCTFSIDCSTSSGHLERWLVPGVGIGGFSCSCQPTGIQLTFGGQYGEKCVGKLSSPIDVIAVGVVWSLRLV